MQAIVWSKIDCPYCDRAKALLKMKGIEYEERVVGVGWTKEQLLEAAPSARSVPQIFIDGLLIGGYDKLKAKFDNEEQS